MKATIIYQKGIGIQPYIFELVYTDTGDRWENLDNIFMQLNNIAENDRFKSKRSMSVGDMVKLNDRIYLCCDEGFIEI